MTLLSAQVKTKRDGWTPSRFAVRTQLYPDIKKRPAQDEPRQVKERGSECQYSGHGTFWSGSVRSPRTQQ